jgi:hypothetical protein
MANDTAFRAGRFLQGQVTQDFAGCGPGNRPTYPNGDCTFFGCPPQTNIPGCGFTNQWGPNCPPSVQNPCITQTEMPGCGAQVGARFGGPGTFSQFGPCVTENGCTVAGEPCRTVPVGGNCRTEPGPFCPPTPQCPTPLCPTPQCPTPNTQCMTTGPECQTHQPPNCPTHNPCCEPTRVHCPTLAEICTAPPVCPDVSIGIACTQLPPQCPRDTNFLLDCTFGCTQFAPNCQTSPQQCAIQITNDPACNPPQFAAAQPGGAGFQVAPTPATRCFICPPRTTPTYPNGDCTFFGCGPRGNAFAAAAPQQTAATVCTQFSQQCQSAIDACPTRICPTYPNGDCTFFGCGPGGGGGQTATVCTQFSQQCRSAVDACPTRLCGGGGAFAAAAPQRTVATVCTQFSQQCPSAVDACPTRICTPATVCTQAAPGCPTYPNGDCTFFGCGPGGGGGTQFGRQCPSAVDACPTRICTPATVCTQAAPGCPTYPNGDCTFFGCGPGGGGGTQFGRQCPSAVDACPTRLCGGGGGQVGAARMGTWPTPMTRCYIC